MQKKENTFTKTVTIEHKTNLTGDDLDKDPNHKLLQEFRNIFQNDHDTEMKNIKKTIETISSKIETDYINEVRRLAEYNIKALPERTVERRRLID